MGRLYHLKCPHCDYDEPDLACGTEFGMASILRTMHCHQCRKLYDQSDHWPVADPLPPLRCRRSRGRHAVIPWQLPGPCPQCGRPITTADAELTVMWD
ncbi:MAG: hypothetical protein H6590_09145 [Flavobacteriales bacterium]|nr:hypothetical protein [Flavobacteriales bacterium]